MGAEQDNLIAVSGARGGSAADAVRVVVPAWIVSRCVVAVAWLLTRTGGFERFAVEGAHAEHGLVLWDGTWYRDLTSMGYDGMDADAQRFFPLYHLLARAVDIVVGNPTVSLSIVSNVSALVAFWALHRLVVVAGFGERVAARSVWWLALFPSAATLVFAYSESLSIALGALALWSLLERRWVVAVPAAFAAGLSRSVGVLVSVALAAAVLQSVRRRRAEAEARRGVGVAEAAAVLAPIVGMTSYLLWLRWRFGSWDAPIESQRTFRAGWRDPLTRLVEGIVDVAGGDGSDVFNVGFALVVIAALALAWRRLPWWASSYVVVTLVVSLSANNINSLGRYALGAFPLAFVVALAEDRLLAGGPPVMVRRIAVTASCISALAMAVYCLWAWSGRMIP